MTRRILVLGVAGALAVAMLTLDAGTAVAATPVDCSSNHYALSSTIAPGSYSITGVCYGPFYTNPGDTTTLTGAGQGAGLDGQGAGSTIGIDGSTVTLQNLAITSGVAAGATGGGIAGYDAADITLTNVTVSGNSAANAGGGVQLDNATMHVNNSTVSGNSTQYGAGGGIEITDGSELYVDGSSIVNNTSGGGAGGGLSVDIANTSGSAYITNSTIKNNTAVDGGGGSYGGGLYLDGGAYVEITGSTVSNNQATSENGQSYGGGISVSSSDIYLTNTAVNSNSAAFGGGIMHWGGTAILGVSLTGSHVDFNTATSDGGGIFNRAANGGADLWLDSTTVSSNRSLNGNGGGIANQGENGYTASASISNHSMLSANRARNGNGGGISDLVDPSGGQATVTIGQSTVGPRPNFLNDGNVAKNGAGIAIDGSNGTAGVSLQSGARVTGNTASVDGGGVFVTGGGTLTAGSGASVTFNHPDNVS